jgi:putative inorganic carbon (HCO3(-)) transporter
MGSVIQRALRGGLIGLFALVPLVVFYQALEPTQIKELVMVAMVALAALGWLWLSIPQQQLQLRLTTLDKILVLNVAVWAFSLAVSPYPLAGIATLCARLAGIGLVLLLPFYLSMRRDLALVLGTTLAVAAAISLYGLLQYLRLDPFLESDGLVGHFRVCSTTIHPNVLVSFLVAVVPLNIVAFVFFGRSIRTRVALALSLALSLCAAAATLSRGGWLALAAATVFTLVWLRRGRSSTRDRESGSGSSKKVIAGITVVVLGLVIALGVGRGALDPGERERLLSVRGPTIDKRVRIYGAALRMARAAPLFGWGPGTFALVLPAYRSPELARYFPRNEYHVEHGVSEPLEILVESGLPGLLAWLMLAGFFVIRPLLLLRRIADPALRALLVGIAAAMLGLVLHGLIEVSLRFHPPLFLFWALPGLGLAVERVAAAGPSQRPRQTLRVRSWPGRLTVGIALGMIFGLAFAVSLSELVANTHAAAGRRALRAGELQTAERSFRAALGTWSNNLPARYRLAWVLWKLGHLEEAEAQYREVIRRSPYYFDANHALARVLVTRDKPREAAWWVARAVRLNPFHVPSHALAVHLALGQGHVVHAEHLAQKIHERAPDDWLANLTLARVRLAQRRPDEARRLLLEAQRRAPQSKEVRRLLRRVSGGER